MLIIGSEFSKWDRKYCCLDLNKLLVNYFGSDRKFYVLWIRGNY